ncbi:MAG: YbaB/EbfC family nucleoid-associated protein [Actinomycetota bacterium]|nr:YbaB/EbfC family nucleoid-associated protein [Actinomycetota bacterium]
MTDEQQPGPGGFDFGSLLNTAQQMQQQMAEAQAEAAATEVTGSAGGGAVEVTLTGGLEARNVAIRPDAVDPDDVEMLEDLVVAALEDALAKVRGLQEQAAGGMDLGSMDLGGLGKMLGGGGLGG